MRGINPGYGQFRWVVLLLAVAVVLPTVCLLWFMGEVVKNERLVVRQRLTTIYKARLVDSDGRGRAEMDRTLPAAGGTPCRSLAYRQFVTAAGQAGCAGLLVFDEAGQRLYPVLSTDDGTLAGAVRRLRRRRGDGGRSAVRAGGRALRAVCPNQRQSGSSGRLDRQEPLAGQARPARPGHHGVPSEPPPVRWPRRAIPAAWP